MQSQLQKQNEELKLKFDTEHTQFSKQKEQEVNSQAEQINELELIIKDLEEENDTLKSKLDKDQAINTQKNEFL